MRISQRVSGHCLQTGTNHRQASADLEDEKGAPLRHGGGQHSYGNPLRSESGGAMEPEDASASDVSAASTTGPVPTPLVDIPSSVFSLIQMTSGGGGSSPIKARLCHACASVGLWSTGYYGAMAWKEIDPVLDPYAALGL